MRKSLAYAAAALALLAACKTNDVSNGVESAGSAVADGAKSVVGAGTSLVNVNLSNVLNDLALDLKLDKANIPVNAQIPVTIAANVCGVSINILSVSTGGSSYAWDFGDGGSSTAAEPSHTYLAPGTFTVTLTATGPGGSDSLSQDVTVTVVPAS